jgi:hypothetical protein
MKLSKNPHYAQNARNRDSECNRLVTSTILASSFHGFGKLGLERAANSVSVGSQADQPRAESSVGEDSKGIAASSRGIENNCLGTCEAHHVSISPEEDRRRSKSEVGEG